MTMPKFEQERRADIRAIMRDIARQIFKLPATRQAEVSRSLISMLRILEEENRSPIDDIEL